mmetsp:Transcript_5640/g.16729  ORF Transcript_5640/g.16729 Transcript_5640/m.16729 type:complete len:139 (+) Transcript_5640:536-952(+)
MHHHRSPFAHMILWSVVGFGICVSAMRFPNLHVVDHHCYQPASQLQDRIPNHLNWLFAACNHRLHFENKRSALSPSRCRHFRVIIRTNTDPDTKAKKALSGMRSSRNVATHHLPMKVTVGCMQQHQHASSFVFNRIAR